MWIDCQAAEELNFDEEGTQPQPQPLFVAQPTPPDLGQRLLEYAHCSVYVSATFVINFDFS